MPARLTVAQSETHNAFSDDATRDSTSVETIAGLSSSAPVPPPDCECLQPGGQRVDHFERVVQFHAAGQIQSHQSRLQLQAFDGIQQEATVQAERLKAPECRQTDCNKSLATTKLDRLDGTEVDVAYVECLQSRKVVEIDDVQGADLTE